MKNETFEAFISRIDCNCLSLFLKPANFSWRQPNPIKEWNETFGLGPGNFLYDWNNAYLVYCLEVEFALRDSFPRERS